MDNPFTTFNIQSNKHSNTETNDTKPMEGISQNSQNNYFNSTIIEPTLPPLPPELDHQNHQISLGSLVEQPVMWSDEQERKAIEAFNSKVARNARKLARLQSITTKQERAQMAAMNMSSGLGFGSGSRRTDAKDGCDIFIVINNKKMRLLLRKQLKKSDVGSLGRIVLPKKEAEENLPTLYYKEAIQLTLKEVFSDKDWSFKFKYWSNNSSRMYVLENTGEFVKQHNLETGDAFFLFEDENKNLYCSVEKKGRQENDSLLYCSIEKKGGQDTELSQVQPNSANQSNPNATLSSLMYHEDEEENASLAVLIEQFNDNKDQNQLLLDQDDQVPNTTLASSSYAQQNYDNTLFSNVSSSSYLPAPPQPMAPPQPAVEQAPMHGDHLNVGGDYYVFPDGSYSYNYSMYDHNALF